MGKKSKIPAAPDYTALAKEQTAQNVKLNRPNQTNTEGSTTWTTDPVTGEMTQSTVLNENNQKLYDAQLANQQQIADQSGQMLQNFKPDYSAIPEMGKVGQFNQQATDLYNQLAQPGLDRQVNSQRARAAAMGIPEFGSRAGTNMNQQLSDAVSRSGMMGAQAGIQQGNIMFDQQNALHRQGYQDIRNQLGDIQGLMGLGQRQSANPNFNPYMGVNAPDLVGAAGRTYDAQVQQANAKNAGRNQLLGSIAGIAGTALGGPIGGMIGSSIGGLFGGGGGPPVYDGGYGQGQGSAYGGTYSNGDTFVPYRQGM